MAEFKAIGTGTDHANKILTFLQKELGIPEHVVGFTLHMRVDDIVRITDMDYIPVEKDADNV